MIGLIGSHRCGKTTLAKAYAEKHKIPACLTTASGVFKQLGYDPQENYPLVVRLEIQDAILRSFELQYGAMSERAFIADRTPIDLMAYTLADITRERQTDEVEMWLERYMNDCFDLCNKFFSTLIVVQPGIKLVDDPTKAPIGFGYIEHIAQLVMGLTVDERITGLHSYIPRRFTDLEERVICVKGAVDVSLDRAGRKIKDQANASGLITVH